MKCQVKSKFEGKKKRERDKELPRHTQGSQRGGPLNVSACLIVPVLAQLYPVSRYPAGHTAEALTASHRPDTGSLSELYWQPSSAMQIPTSTWAGPSLALPIHLYSVSLPPGTLTHTHTHTRCPYASCCYSYLGWEGGWGLKQIG